jgi:hypothetical protein
MFLWTSSNFFQKSIQNLSMDIQMFFKRHSQMFLGTGIEFLSKIYTTTFRGYTDILQRIHTNVSRDTQQFFQKYLQNLSKDIQRLSKRQRCFSKDTHLCF